VTCQKRRLFTIAHPRLGPVDVWRSDDGPLFFKSRLSIDADGAPNAYHPPPREDLGLDYLANAGDGQDWFGIATNAAGKPYVQSSGPFAGFYVSTTALVDEQKAVSDPARYVDASTVPYIVMPGEPEPQHPRDSASLGDFAAVYSERTHKLAFAIFAEIGPQSSIGEGSIQLGDDLGSYAAGQPRNAKDGVGVATASILYIVFPGTRRAPAWPVALPIIRSEGERRFAAWGGLDRLHKCFPELGGG
jgi:hypothetical protein